jgi:hypothetical protein
MSLFPFFALPVSVSLFYFLLSLRLSRQFCSFSYRLIFLLAYFDFFLPELRLQFHLFHIIVFASIISPFSTLAAPFAATPDAAATPPRFQYAAESLRLRRARPPAERRRHGSPPFALADA